MTTRKLAAFTAVLASVALIAAGCGSDDSSDSKSGSGGTATTAANPSGGSSAAKDAVTKLTTLTGVQYPEPTDPVDPGDHKVSIISCGNAASACLNAGKAAKDAASAIGWESTEVLDGKFTPSVVSGYINDAVERGYDAIFIASFDMAAVKAAVENAASKKVKIVCWMCVGDDAASGVLDVGTDATTDGQAIGTYVAANAKSGAHLLVYNDPAYPNVRRRIAGVKEMVTKYCGGCKIEEHDVATADLAKPGPPFFNAALTSHAKGSIDWLVAPYGTIAQPMLKTTTDQGRTEINTVSFDSITANTDLLTQADSPYAADTGLAGAYFAWAGIDVLARALAGKPLWADHDKMPVVLLTKDNIADAKLGKASGFFEPSDFDYESKLKQLWGVS